MKPSGACRKKIAAETVCLTPAPPPALRRSAAPSPLPPGRSTSLRHGGAPARAVGRWVGGWTAAAALVAALAVARVAAARGDVQVDEPAARGAAAVARATATAPHGASWSRVEVKVAQSGSSGRHCPPGLEACQAAARARGTATLPRSQAAICADGRGRAMSGGVQNSAPMGASAGEIPGSAGHNPADHVGALGRGGKK